MEAIAGLAGPVGHSSVGGGGAFVGYEGQGATHANGVEATVANGEERGAQNLAVLDKGRMDNASALLRLIEKALDLNARAIRPSVQSEGDAEDLAETMRIIDERIVTLARAFAEDIAAGREVVGLAG